MAWLGKMVLHVKRIYLQYADALCLLYIAQLSQDCVSQQACFC